MLAIFLIFSFAMYENLFYKKVNTSKTKFFDYAIIFSFAGLGFATIGIAYYSIMNANIDLEFFSDWRFWLYLGVELVGMYTLNLNYINNPKNHTIINVGIFSTVLLTPIIVYIFDKILGFENTLHIKIFEEPINILIYVAIYSIIGFAYFWPKIKNKELNKFHLVVITVIFLLLSFYIEIKLLQTYRFNWFIYSVFEFLLAFIYGIQSYIIEKNEIKQVNKNHFIGGLYYTIFGSLHLIGLTLLAVELGVLIRRVSQIVAGIFTDKKYHSRLDIFLIILMILGGVFLLYSC